MKIEFKNIINMRRFEAELENLSAEEFRSKVSEFQGKKIDEKTDRTEKFDFQDMGTFFEETVENYLRELSSMKSLKEEQLEELIKKIKEEDQDVKEELMEGVLKKVAKIAIQYSKVGTSYIELVQDGLMGVVLAIENYTLDNEMTFSEYMDHWIKFEMIKSNKLMVNELKSPIIAYFKNVKVEVYKKHFSGSEKEVNEEEIKKNLGMDLEEFRNLEKIREYGFLIKEEDKDELKDYTTIAEVDEEIEKLHELMSVSNLGNKFTNEEIEILDLYYGLSGKRKYVEDISKILEEDSLKIKNKIKKIMIKLKYNGKRAWIDEN